MTASPRLLTHCAPICQGKRCGSLARVACFSFYPGKNLGAWGDGGAVTTDDDEVANFARMYRNYGGIVKYDHQIKGVNTRLDTLQAVVLDVKLKLLDAWNARRREIAAKYISELSGVGDLAVPVVRDYGEPTWHLFVVDTAKRDELLAHLHSRDIGAGIHYPKAAHEHDAFPELASQAHRVPAATRRAPRILTLPVFPEMTDEQAARVVAEVKAFFA